MSLESVIKVLVVDDDFMIARLHAQFIHSLQYYKVTATANSGSDTLAELEKARYDLVILDVYLPDKSGIEVLREIRSRGLPCDVILITAAKELKVVEEGFRLGIFDYLMKPFNLDRLGETMNKYTQFKRKLSAATSFDQMAVDNLRQILAPGGYGRVTTESGVDPRTLDRIRQTLEQAGKACTAEEIAEQSGVSRSTARSYLAYMVEKDIAVEELSYGTVGRPRRLFSMVGSPRHKQ